MNKSSVAMFVGSDLLLILWVAYWYGTCGPLTILQWVLFLVISEVLHALLVILGLDVLRRE